MRKNAATAGRAARVIESTELMLDAARRLISPSARSDVPPSMVMDVMAAAARTEAAAERVLHLEVGQPAAAAPATAIGPSRPAPPSEQLRAPDPLAIAP